MAEAVPEVLTERRDGVLVITINRPHAKNAITEGVARDIAAAIDELDGSDDLRAAVLTGAGGTFCSGMDLKGFLRGESPVVESRGLAGLTQAPPRKPLIAAVEGWALAGGFEILLACDMVVAAQTARFGVPETKRALVAGAGAALLLPQRIPLPIALELLLTGDPITAQRAYDLGIANRITPEGEALEEALALAAVIATNGPLAVAVTKEIARSASDWTVEEGWKQQAKLLAPVFISEDAQEGATAFAEKRSPVWIGR
jgi:enoyl-CoA hydratase